MSIYANSSTQSQIRNLAADRANIAKLQTESIDTSSLTADQITTSKLIVEAGDPVPLEFPTGSLTITSNGAGTSLTEAPFNGDLQAPDSFYLRTLSAGTGISFTTTDANIEIVNNSPASSVTLAGTGAGATLVNDGVGPDLLTKDLIAGTGISLTQATTSVEIVNTVSLASAGGGSSLVSDGANPTLVIRDITGSGFMNVTQGATVNVGAAGQNSTLLRVTNGVGTVQFDSVALRIADSAGNQPALASTTLVSNGAAIAAGADCQSTAAYAVTLGRNAHATANRAICIANGDTPYTNSHSNSIAIGNNVGGVNVTHFACSTDADFDILGRAHIRGRLLHGLIHQKVGYAGPGPTVIAANDVWQGSIFCSAVGGGIALTLPTSANLLAANAGNFLWYAANQGAFFFIKNKNGAACTLSVNTNSLIYDNTNASVASLVIPDDRTAVFRVYLSSDVAPYPVIFEHLGDLTF